MTTHQDVVRLLLVPDANAARRIRRRLAEAGLGIGVVAATWPELLERAAHSCLQPWPEDDWERGFQDALLACGDAFWLESLAVAPDETTATVETALLDVITATDPLGSEKIKGLKELPARARRHLEDLWRLKDALHGCLPADLALIRALLGSPATEALYPIQVLHVAGTPWLNRWQQALVDKLNEDAQAGKPAAALTAILEAVLCDTNPKPAQGALGVVQTQLYAPVKKRTAVDDSLQWVGCRDALEEVEVAAGMVQSLQPKKSSTWAGIGLLVPDDPTYHRALEEVFGLAGIPLSGLPRSKRRRDLGLEAVYNFLHCREQPAPAMALAACLTSPLMPWSRRQGQALADAVLGGDRRLRPWSKNAERAQPMLDPFQDGDWAPDTLAQALRTFASLLRGGKDFHRDVKGAEEAVQALCALLDNAKSIDWPALRRQVGYACLLDAEDADFNREGLTVWRESQEPWRAVEQLIVLGFAQGHYPGASGRDPVFSAADRDAIRHAYQLPLRLPAEQLNARRQRFKRQLGAVRGAVTFLIPRRDGHGRLLNPSESLVFMHELFTGPEAAGERILDLDVAADRARVRHLAIAEAEAPQAPRALVSDDLSFNRDLLALRCDDKGQPNPESPSGLETLMVSSLAWLLRRLDAQPQIWAAEGTEPLILGSLAHRVFEGLFQPGKALPDSAAIPKHIERLLDTAITEIAPFLAADTWAVERRHFAKETAKAALAWRDMLAGLKAKVLATETWLQGNWLQGTGSRGAKSGITIHGQSDLLLRLPGQQLAVVDYKRSKSAGRRSRMEKGYDSQASLYRIMLQTGGLKETDDAKLTRQLQQAKTIAVVYFMLNDQTALSDTPLKKGKGASAPSIPGWQIIEGDVASQAMTLIKQRVKEIRKGTVRLNRDSDAEFFDKQAGLSPYALNDSPLIALFTRADDQEVLA